ncbi:hypothetical protein [Shewanella algae]|uniref:Uncharacterized protein n=1 Tax=Shewanella algae TaxID=38313 RepID=A0A7T8EAM8_9GAMM|nr:hypothetical protein [Shewanella algae]MDL2195819.1 hypothetical protein [Shewanella algae]PST67006.1 hypothetical protein AYI77_10690 [Shewanella algae]QQO82893.1 hypothetical protein D7032_06300 [Shewanella algae]
MEKELFGLLGVIVGFVLNLIYGTWGKRNQKKQEQYYLAVVVTLQLDRFFDNAVKLCSDNGMKDEHGDYCPSVPYPELELPGSEVNWRCLPQNVMKDILWMPETIREALLVIDSIREHRAERPDFDEFYEARQYEFAKIALTANELSSKLRKIVALPDRIVGDQFFKPLEFLSNKVMEIEKVRNDREQYDRIIAEQLSGLRPISD